MGLLNSFSRGRQCLDKGLWLKVQGLRLTLYSVSASEASVGEEASQRAQVLLIVEFTIRVLGFWVLGFRVLGFRV